MTTTLQLPLKGCYFDAIAAGAKVEEYRLQTSYWVRRLAGRSFDRVVLTRGYPTGGGVEGVTRLTRAWRGYREDVLQHPHFGPDPVAVFAIDVSVALDSAGGLAECAGRAAATAREKPRKCKDAQV